ncbi:LysE family translocator [Caldiplasma sukawensis]
MSLPFLIIIGLFLGISMAAPPGPVMAMIMGTSKRSPSRGIMIGLGAMTADIILLILVLTVSEYVDFELYSPIIFLIGGTYFLFLGSKIASIIIKNQEMPEPESGNYVKGLLTGITNPMQITWWFTSGLGMLDAYGIFPFYFFYVSIVMYLIFFSILVYRASLKWERYASVVLDVISATILLIFSLYFIYKGIYFSLPFIIKNI